MHGWQRFVSVLVCGLVAGLGWTALASAQGQSLTLNLASQNNSGITGTATLTDIGGGKTRVEIRATAAGAGPEPSHIHQGSCAQLNPTPAFPLSDVRNGSSTTEIDASLQQLTGSPHAVHMHKSADELTVYLACADVLAAAAPASLPRTGDQGDWWIGPGALLAGFCLVAAGGALRRRWAA